MPLGMHLISGFTTATPAALTDVTVSNGDSLQVRYSANPDIFLLNMWSDFKVVGRGVLKSPNLHDNTNGIMFSEIVSNVLPLMPWGLKQRLVTQDNLTLQHLGTAAAGLVDITSLLLYYKDLNGADGNYFTWEQIEPMIEQVMGFRTNLVTTVAGQYGTTVAFNSTDAQFKANRNYAVIGYLTNAECTTVGFFGPCTSNFRIGGPGTDDFRTVTPHWFKWLSQTYGVPAIPVFNAADVGATLAFGLQDEILTAVNVTWIAVLLRDGPLPLKQRF